MTTIVINNETYNVTMTPCVEVAVTDANGGTVSRRVVQQALIDTLGELDFSQGEANDAYNIVHPPPATEEVTE